MSIKEISPKQTRPCLVSGLFYPAVPEELQNLMTEKLKVYPEGDDTLIVTPHGSYSVCGDTIAAGFASCSRNEPDTVILIGPVHRETAHPVLSLPEKSYFETPLGPVEVNRKMRKSLITANGPFRADDIPHREEHSLEVQLPYIRHLFPEARILPILSGTLNRKTIRKAADLLKKAIKEDAGKVLTVLTLNLSDFLPLETAEAHGENLKDMLKFPLERSLLEELKQGEISTCGTVVLTLASEMFAPAGKARFLFQQNSRVQDHGTTKGVYYGAFSWPDPQKEEKS